MPQNLEKEIFNLLKKYYIIGAYFPYSFVKAQFPNESFGNMLKAFNYLKKNKIIENISNSNYKFIKNEFNFSNSEYVDTIDIKKKSLTCPFIIDEKEEKLSIINIQSEIIEYIHSYYAIFDKYPIQKNIIDEIHDTIDIMFKNKIIKRVNFSIVPVVENNFPDNIIEKKIIKYLYSYYNMYKKYLTIDNMTEVIQHTIDTMIRDNILKIDNSFIIPVNDDKKKKKQIDEKEDKYDFNLIKLIKDTIVRFKRIYNCYPSKESICLIIDSDRSKEEIRKHIKYMISINYLKEDQSKRLILSSDQDKKEEKSSNNEININTEIRKLYGYITKQNKQLKAEFFDSIKEISHIQQNIIKECAKNYDEIEKMKKEINNIINIIEAF